MQPTVADRVGAGCLVVFGVALLGFALLIVVGYGMSESNDIALLIGAVAVVGGLGVGCLMLARAVTRSRRA